MPFRAFALLAATLATAALADTDPGMGTWALNRNLSKYKPGPPFKSLVITFEPAGEGVKMSNELVNANDAVLRSQYVAYYDGKEYPITGLPDIETIALQKAENGKVLRTDRMGRTVVQTFVRTISADGQTMVIRQKGRSDNGGPYDNYLVFDRQ